MTEQVHTDFCKYTLNVSKYASNDACMGELGRYPISILLHFMAPNTGHDLKMARTTFLFSKAWELTGAEMLPWAEDIRHLFYTATVSN